MPCAVLSSRWQPCSMGSGPMSGRSTFRSPSVQQSQCRGQQMRIHPGVTPRPQSRPLCLKGGAPDWDWSRRSLFPRWPSRPAARASPARSRAPAPRLWAGAGSTQRTGSTCRNFGTRRPAKPTPCRSSA
eukprot:6165238-Lingulodinium_polyedra.AAC.1